MEVVLTIIQVHAQNEYILSYVHIPIQSPEDYIPLLQRIQSGLEDMRSRLDPQEISLYWRMTDSRFIPIYDYVTYAAAWGNIASNHLYLVVRDLDCPSKEWDGATADEPRPIDSLRSRAGDERLLAALCPVEPRGVTWLGHTYDVATITRQVLDTLKGSSFKLDKKELEKVNSEDDNDSIAEAAKVAAETRKDSIESDNSHKKGKKIHGGE